MKYCPLCAAEYREEAETCSTCGAVLVASLSAEEVRANPPRLLWIGRDSTEFDLVAGALRDANIPELVEEGPTGILQKFLKSESQICVLQNDFERALEAAARAMASRGDDRRAVQKCYHCGAACSPSLTVCPTCRVTLIVERKIESKNPAPMEAKIQEKSKYCPLCDAEYGSTFEKCSVCGVDLVPEELRGRPLNEQDQKDRMTLIWRGGDPVAVSRVVSVLREAGIRHHVEATHDHFVFELAMPRPRYVVRILQSDAEKARHLLTGISDSPFFGAEPSPDFAAESGLPVPRTRSPWNLAAATVEVWAGQDTGLARVLEDCLRENQIGYSRIVRQPQTLHLLVMSADESQAREIIREVLEATPPA